MNYSLGKKSMLCLSGALLFASSAIADPRLNLTELKCVIDQTTVAFLDDLGGLELSPSISGVYGSARFFLSERLVKNYPYD